MSNRTLQRLVRWRGFGESRAADALRRSSFEAAQAQDRVDAAVEALDALELQRSDLVERGSLDLARVHAAAQIAEDGRAKLEERRDELATARDLEALARDRHLRARADTRVSDTRRARLAMQEQDREEKTSFDRIADAHQALKGKNA